MKKGLLILIGLLFVTSFTSCKKEEKVVEPTKEELLQEHTWIGNEVVQYDASGAEVGRRAIPQYEFLFAVNKDYFIYDSGELQGSGDWAYTTGTPDVITLTPHSTSRPAAILKALKDIQYRASSAPMDFDVEKLTSDEFVFSATSASGKVVYYLKK